MATLGPLFGSFWALLGVSWTPVARFLDTLGRIWALMGASSLDLGGLLVPLSWVSENSNGSFHHGSFRRSYVKNKNATEQEANKQKTGRYTKKNQMSVNVGFSDIVEPFMHWLRGRSKELSIK